jgi:hypothetical protein
MIFKNRWCTAKLLARRLLEEMIPIKMTTHKINRTTGRLRLWTSPDDREVASIPMLSMVPPLEIRD